MGLLCLRKCGDMLFGFCVVCVLMLWYVLVSCCCVNGSEIGCDGSVSDCMVCLILLFCDLLNVGLLGKVEMEVKCCVNVLRLLIGEVVGIGLVKGGSGCCVVGRVWCYVVYIIWWFFDICCISFF